MRPPRTRTHVILGWLTLVLVVTPLAPPASATQTSTPPSRDIVFIRWDGNDTELWVVNAATGVERQLTHNRTDDLEPAWSPDRTRIAFTRFLPGAKAIFVMDADGGGLVQLTPRRFFASNPTWSPDGSKLAFAGNVGGRGTNIWRMWTDGSHRRQLTDTPNVEEYAPAWQPSGMLIAYERVRRGVHAIFTLLASDGSLGTRVTRDAESAANPTWEGNDRIAYDAWPPRATSRDVYSRPADSLGDGHAQRVVKRPGWDLQPSIDGSTGWVAWQCAVEGYEICIRSPHGKPIVLTSNITDDEDPNW